MRFMIQLLLLAAFATFSAAFELEGNAVRTSIVDADSNGSVNFALQLKGGRYKSPLSSESVLKFVGENKIDITRIPEGAAVMYDLALRHEDLTLLRKVCLSDANYKLLQEEIGNHLGQISKARNGKDYFLDGRVDVGTYSILFPALLDSVTGQRLPCLPLVFSSNPNGSGLSFESALSGSVYSIISLANSGDATVSPVPIFPKGKANAVTADPRLNLQPCPVSARTGKEILIYMNIIKYDPGISIADLNKVGNDADATFLTRLFDAFLNDNGAFILDHIDSLSSQNSLVQDRMGITSVEMLSNISIVAKQTLSNGVGYIYENKASRQLGVFWIYKDAKGRQVFSVYTPDEIKFREFISLYQDQEWLKFISQSYK